VPRFGQLSKSRSVGYPEVITDESVRTSILQIISSKSPILISCRENSAETSVAPAEFRLLLPKTWDLAVAS
jgi:hypothetical protein